MSAAALHGWLVPRRAPGAEGESCSSRPGDLEPYDALTWRYGAPTEVALDAPPLVRLARLSAALHVLAAATSADWLGVYRIVSSPTDARPSAAGERCLVKEAYLGAPSRPFFPLTAAFAAHSNNSSVALRGEAALIDDTQVLGEDDAYYICDGRVRSELCAPIFDAAGVVIGIIDAEAFEPGFFNEARVDAVLLACAVLGETNLLVAESA